MESFFANLAGSVVERRLWIISVDFVMAGILGETNEQERPLKPLLGRVKVEYGSQSYFSIL